MPTAKASTPKRTHKPKTIPAELPRTGLVRAWVVRAFYPVSDEQLRRQVAAGEFPAPVRIGKRAVAWRASEVHAHLQKLQEAA